MEAEQFQESPYESSSSSDPEEANVTLESESDQSFDLFIEFEHDDLIICYEENIHLPNLEPEISNTAADTETGD